MIRFFQPFHLRLHADTNPPVILFTWTHFLLGSLQTWSDTVVQGVLPLLALLLHHPSSQSTFNHGLLQGRRMFHAPSVALRVKVPTLVVT